MDITEKRIWKCIGVFLGIVLLALLFPTKGCVESSFLLANESRLPKWLTVPSGLKRQDVTVSLFVYTGGDARFIMRGPAPDRKTILNILTRAGWHESTLQEKKRRGNFDFRPQYYSVSYKGMNDIIKFPCKGPVFWMADEIDTNISSVNTECPPIDDSLIGRDK